MKTTVALALMLLALVVGCAPGKKAATLPAVTIVPRSGWNANEPKPYKQQTPVRITVHHEGTKLEVTDDAAKKIKAIQVWGMGKDRNWADIPYHFLIAPDGTIYEGRAVTTAGETATEYDPSGHLLITCLGNLEVQEVPENQLASLVNLIAYTSKKYHIPRRNPHYPPRQLHPDHLPGQEPLCLFPERLHPGKSKGAAGQLI